MTDELKQLENWLQPLINKLNTAERAKLARKIGTALRRSQQQRIKDQRNPAGTPYAPRKSQEYQGRIKRKAMFQKLRQAKHMRLNTTPNSVSIGFIGNVAKIAQVHQYGLRDRVRPGGPTVQYEKRELLGFTKADEELVMDLVIDHLGL